MKHLSMIALIACLAFTPAGNSSSTSANNLSVTPDCSHSAARWIVVNESPAVNMQVKYFWFVYPEDYYWDFKSLNDEINEMWMYYGAPVDTRPAGGTLIDRGYMSSVYPHMTYAFQYLYVHY